MNARRELPPVQRLLHHAVARQKATSQRRYAHERFAETVRDLQRQLTVHDLPSMAGTGTP